MPSDPAPTGNGPLRKLAEALLNASLLLTAIVLALALALVVQVRGLASDLHDGLQTQLATIQPRLEATRETMREALVALDGAGAGPTPDEPPAPELALARDRLRAALDNLSALEVAPGPGVADGDGATDTLMRRLALAIIALAARGVLDGTQP